MKRLASAALLVLLAALVVAGCGGGGTTTVIEKTVTVGGEEGAAGGSGATGEAEAKGEEREAIAEVEAEEAQASAEVEAEAEEKAAGGGQAEDQIEAPTRVVHVQTFRSPSGNIGCAMFEGGARCDIRKREWSPPTRPASCSEEVDFGQGLNVAHDGKASFVCAGDTTLDPSAKALAYGEASELGGTICMSRSAGITCANHAGHGFFISIQRYKLF